MSSEHWTGIAPRALRPSLLLRVVAFFARRLRRFPVRLQLWTGEVLTPHPGAVHATIVIQNLKTLVQILLDPVFRLAEAYRTRAITVRGDLVGALEELFRNQAPRPPAPARFRRAAVDRAGEDASRHYDLGNDFFRLWLDEQMVYTCAYFWSPLLTLEQAQLAKLELVCRKLRLTPGQSVLEAGCGWGGLARYMAARHGVSVTACNVSREQIQYARRRARDEGLDSRIQFLAEDFRNVSGRFDVFVSVGMLEHVGLANYPDLGRVIHERLDPRHGRGLLHFIGRNHPRAVDRWTRKRIFPGSYCPTLSEAFSRVLEPWDFSVLDVENLRPHYVRTLAEWRRRFEQAAPRAAVLFDERFIRSWRLYLASSQAAFAAGSLQLFQAVFARGCEDDVPWTRRHIYGEVDSGRDEGVGRM
jgi:cyclopropane-fatty-acyl-phospholipid synthase